MLLLELVLAKAILQSKYDIAPNKIVGMYSYGSLNYGTLTENSDYDYVVIVDMKQNDYLQYETDDLDIHFISVDYYKQLLVEHDIMALECYYHKNPILKYETSFDLNLITLRKKISAICNNSWAKAGKKMNLPEEDDYIGLKSLFHSFRILSYGIQLARDGEIRFSNCGLVGITDNFFRELKHQFDLGKRWDYFKEKYKSEHNEMATQFRLLAPKE